MDHITNGQEIGLTALPVPQEQSTPKPVEHSVQSLPARRIEKIPLLPLSPIVYVKRLTGTKIIRSEPQAPHHPSKTAPAPPSSSPPVTLLSPLPRESPSPPPPSLITTQEEEASLGLMGPNLNHSSSGDDFCNLRTAEKPDNKNKKRRVPAKVHSKQGQTNSSRKPTACNSQNHIFECGCFK